MLVIDPLAAGRPTAAGMYDFYLGGSAHSAADRAAAEKITALIPETVDGAWANRGFLQRAVRAMASQWGLRQFIDIGAGLPTQRNTHDVLTEAGLDARVVYVDIDPAVTARGRELVAGLPQVAVIEGDVRDPVAILEHPQTRRLIDPDRPVGLLLVAVLHFVADEEDPWALVGRYRDAVASGSYLALSHASLSEHFSPPVHQAGTAVYATTATPLTDRTRAEIERLFTGWQLLPPYAGAEPGLAYLGTWGAEDPGLADSEGSRLGYAAVARKP